MSAYAPDKAATVVPFAPTPKGQQPEVVADEIRPYDHCLAAEGGGHGEGRLRPRDGPRA